MKTIIILTFISVSIFATKLKVAKVLMLRGSAKVVMEDGSKQIALQKNDWLREGEVIKTSAKSFVRLKFVDDSKVNLGPKSELVIERFKQDETGVLSLVSGKIRAKVSKDYLKMKKNKSKLFVKSNDAVMGIRGTDFIFSANAKTKKTHAVLFEGSVVFNKLPSRLKNDFSKFESIVNRGVRIRPGEFSIVGSRDKRPSPSRKMNKHQFNRLYKNKEFTQKKLARQDRKVLVDSFQPKDVMKDMKFDNQKKANEGFVIEENTSQVIEMDSSAKAVIMDQMKDSGELRLYKDDAIANDTNKLDMSQMDQTIMREIPKEKIKTLMDKVPGDMNTADQKLGDNRVFGTTDEKQPIDVRKPGKKKVIIKPCTAMGANCVD